MVGSFILTPISNLLRGYLSSVSGLHTFVLGLILIAVLLFRPDGILPQLKLFFNGLIKKSKAKKGV